MPITVLSELIESRSWLDVLDRLDSHPKEASVKVQKGGKEHYPLHDACRNRPTEEVVEALISLHRPALYHRGEFGYIPLHFAIKHEASLDVVACLTNEYSYGARTKEDSGKLPIHMACQYGAHPDIVNLLLINHPQAIIMTDHSNKRPMDYATTDKCYTTGYEGDIIRVLDRATWYCKVSKAATVRASDEFDAKMTLVERSHNKEIERQERRLEAERQKFKEAVEQKEKENKEEKERNEKVEGELNTKLEEMISKAGDLAQQLEEHKKNAKEDLQAAKMAHETLTAEYDKESERANGLTEALHACEAVLAEREKREKGVIEDLKKTEASLSAATNDNEELWSDLEKEREHANDLAEALQGCQLALSDREKKHAEEERDLLAKLRVAEETIMEKTDKINELSEQITSEEKLAEIITELEGLLVEKEKEWKEKMEVLDVECKALKEAKDNLTSENKELSLTMTEKEEKHSKESEEYLKEIEELQVSLASTEVAAKQEKEQLEGTIQQARDDHSKEKTELEGKLEEAHEKYAKQKVRHETRVKELVAMLDEAHEAHMEQEAKYSSHVKKLEAKLAEAHTREARQVSTVQELEMMLTDMQQQAEEAKDLQAQTAEKKAQSSKTNMAEFMEESMNVSHVEAALGEIRRVISQTLTYQDNEEDREEKHAQEDMQNNQHDATDTPTEESELGEQREENTDKLPGVEGAQNNTPQVEERTSAEDAVDDSVRIAHRDLPSIIENDLIQESRRDAGNQNKERIQPPVMDDGCLDDDALCTSAFCSSDAAEALFGPLEVTVPMLTEKVEMKAVKADTPPVSVFGDSNQSWAMRYIHE